MTLLNYKKQIKLKTYTKNHESAFSDSTNDTKYTDKHGKQASCNHYPQSCYVCHTTENGFVMVLRHNEPDTKTK